MSPALAGQFFNMGATWEAPLIDATFSQRCPDAVLEVHILSFSSLKSSRWSTETPAEDRVPQDQWLIRRQRNSQCPAGIRKFPSQGCRTCREGARSPVGPEAWLLSRPDSSNTEKQTRRGLLCVRAFARWETVDVTIWESLFHPQGNSAGCGHRRRWKGKDN